MTSPQAPNNRPLVIVVANQYPSLSETFVSAEVKSLAARMEVRTYSLKRPVGHLKHSNKLALAAPASKGAMLVWMLLALLHQSVRWYRVRLRRQPGARSFIKHLYVVGHGLRLRRKLGRDRESVVLHAHFFAAPAEVARIAARGRPWSRVVTVHAGDAGFRATSENLEILSSFQHIRFASSYVQKVMSACAALPPSSVIPCVLEIPSTTPRERIGRDSIVSVLTIARLLESKGIREAFAAVLELAKKIAPRRVRWTVVGGGPLEPWLRERGALPPNLELSVAGPIPRPELQPYFDDADIFLLIPRAPTEDETGAPRGDGLPVALMEALGSATPTVATAVAGIPELVLPRQTGWLVEPGDVEGVAEALSEIAADAESARVIADAGAEFVRTNFSPERSTRSLAAVLSGAAEKHSRTGGKAT